MSKDLDISALHYPSRSEIKALIKMDCWHVLGRVFDFVPVFMQVSAGSKKTVIDWRCVPPSMYQILNYNRDDMLDKLNTLKQSNVGIISPKRERLWLSQNGICHYCRNQIERKNWTVEHLVPISKGGSRIPANEVGACKSCNNARGNQSIESFLSSDYMKKFK